MLESNAFLDTSILPKYQFVVIHLYIYHLSLAHTYMFRNTLYEQLLFLLRNCKLNIIWLLLYYIVCNLYVYVVVCLLYIYIKYEYMKTPDINKLFSILSRSPPRRSWFIVHGLRIFPGIKVIFLKLHKSVPGHEIKSKMVRSVALTNESSLIAVTTVLYIELCSALCIQ